jgi:hypothetical protein
MDARTRGRVLARLTRLLSAQAKLAGAAAVASGKWLADLVVEAAPHLPVRDLETLSRHHDGKRGEDLADSVVAAAIRATAAVGAAGGALATVEFAAPPTLLSAPVQLAAETLVVVAIELKLIAELHEIYGRRPSGAATARSTAYVVSWAQRRGIDPTNPTALTGVLGAAARRDLRKRLSRRMGRNISTFVPFLAGAVAGAGLNGRETRKLAEAVRRDLRRPA